MASVELRGVTKVFSERRREPVRALDAVQIHIPDGEFLTVVGPSGSGKTTLLRIIAGLERPSEGTVAFDGVSVNDAPPDERNVAMVFQDAALLPHLTVRENLTLVLKLRKAAATEIVDSITDVSERVGIRRLLDRLPQDLSGGERQRAALARSILRRPKVFLFDEPLSSLDAQARWHLRSLIVSIHRETRATMVYVTHDQQEALALGQRVAVMRDGALQQLADPLTLYRSPANAFVAGFIGSPPMNLFRGHIGPHENSFAFKEHNVPGAANGTRLEAMLDGERAARLAGFADGNIILGIRTEHIVVGSDDRCHVRAIVQLVEFLGADALLHCSTGATQFRVRVATGNSHQPGDRIPLWLDLSQAVFFNPVSEKVMV